MLQECRPPWAFPIAGHPGDSGDASGRHACWRRRGVPIAKTNLDQFATGLVGTRSPYGACLSVPAPDQHQRRQQQRQRRRGRRADWCRWRLGTDTAGSGRVPAAFNGIVGLKADPRPGFDPRGLPGLPIAGLRHDVHPHRCRRTRCALGVLRGTTPPIRCPDAAPAALPPIAIAHRFETIGIPAGPLDLDPDYAMAWRNRAWCTPNPRACGWSASTSRAFSSRGQLLYAGPWLAERYARFRTPAGDRIALRSTPRCGVVRAARHDGRRRVRGVSSDSRAFGGDPNGCGTSVDALLLPITPTHPTPAEVAADPLGVNARLGTFTNFVNLLDLCAVAVPGVQTADGRPFGVQLIAPAFADAPLLDLAARWWGGAGVHAAGRPVPRSWPWWAHIRAAWH